jgi:hypothetical protein
MRRSGNGPAAGWCQGQPIGAIQFQTAPFTEWRRHISQVATESRDAFAKLKEQRALLNKSGHGLYWSLLPK